MYPSLIGMFKLRNTRLANLVPNRVYNRSQSIFNSSITDRRTEKAGSDYKYRNRKGKKISMSNKYS